MRGRWYVKFEAGRAIACAGMFRGVTGSAHAELQPRNQASSALHAHHHHCHRLLDTQLTSPSVNCCNANCFPGPHDKRNPRGSTSAGPKTFPHGQCRDGSQTMQTLWSRSLRATKCTCRCHQCLSYSTAIARRATAAARKRFLAIPSSTIFYSAIFACAAVADGRAKQHRRDQWNSAINGVKGDLNPDDADTRTAAGAEDEMTPEGMRINKRRQAADRMRAKKHLEDMDAEDIAELLKRTAAGYKDPNAAEEAMRDTLAQAHKSAGDKSAWSRAAVQLYDGTEQEFLDWEEAQKYSMLQAARPKWPPNTGPPFDRRNLPPQSIYASDDRKLEGLDSRWTRRKMQTMNLSMAKLVLRIAWETDLSAYPLLRQWNPTLPEAWLPENIFWVAIKKPEVKEKFMMRIEDYLIFTKQPSANRIPEFNPIFGKHPHYEQDPDGEFHRKCHLMNKRIFDAFDACFQGKINLASLIGTVCEELLTASAPPNITTYNALLLGFSRLKKPHLCDMVIESMHEVHMRPDEITCTAALNHHIKTDEPRRFSKFIQLLTGMTTTNYALMLARPTLPLNHPATLAKLNNRVLRHPHTPAKLVQKAYPTPRVMNAIVSGLLKFHGLERTIDICATLLADGWGFDADGLTRFLHACAEREDWEAGMAVWNQLQLLRQQRPATRPLDRHTYLHMLGLCWRCGRDDDFAAILREASEVAGYRAGALKKEFEKMQRDGLGVFEMRAERQADWLLRFEMAAKLEAEGRLVEEKRAAAAADGKQQGFTPSAGAEDPGGEAGAEAKVAAAAADAAAAAAATTSAQQRNLQRKYAADHGVVDDELDPIEVRFAWKPPVVSSQPSPPPAHPGQKQLGEGASSQYSGWVGTSRRVRGPRRPGDGRRWGDEEEGDGWMD